MFLFLQNFVSRWDGHSYLFLATNGYVTKGDEAAFIVFPPFYPLLIRVVNFIVQNPPLSAFLISSLCLTISIIVFYKLLRVDYPKSKSIWITITLIIFPTSYFFVAAYPESLFVLLTISAFFFSRKNNFLAAVIFAGLATLTRPFGVLIWPVLFIEWFTHKKRNWLDLALIISFLICSSAIYLSLNYSLFGDPFKFGYFLQNHWQKSFIPPWIGIMSSWQRGITTPNSNFEYKYLVGYTEAIASTVLYIFILFNFLFKKLRIRFSYLVYFVSATLLMTSTGFLLSTPRYLLSIPPFFIILGSLTNQKFIRIIWSVVSIILLLYFSSLFIKGHWTF